MYKLLIYLVATSTLLGLNFFNRKKIRRRFSELGSNQKVTLTDADLIPILGTDSEQVLHPTNRKAAAVALQKSILVSELYAGVHTIIVILLLLEISYLSNGSIINIVFFLAICYFIHVNSKFAFLHGLVEIINSIYLSPGQSTAGKSFYYFNPLFGYKYFAYSKQLDDSFGLFDNNRKSK